MRKNSFGWKRYSEGLAHFSISSQFFILCIEGRKFNIDYKVHTSGVKVIKNNMTDKLILEELDLVLEIEEYIEDHNPHNLKSPLEADNVIAEFKIYMGRFRKFRISGIYRTLFFYSTSVKDRKKPICLICGKNDHKSYISPFSGKQRVSYFWCDKFINALRPVTKF